MTRTALISDIHGHLFGLKAVLSDIKLNQCERIICLGDLVEGGDYDQEVVCLLSDLNIACVQGNHDRGYAYELDKDVADFLLNLPENIIKENILYTHISPRTHRLLPVNNPIEAWNIFDETDYRLIFVGHVHIPFLFGEHCEEACSAMVHPFQYNKAFQLDNTDRYIISVGAVGYSRDKIKKPRYVIYDDKANTVEFRLVEAALLAGFS